MLREIRSFLCRYGRALWALRHDRSALLLRFELGFIDSLTMWEAKGRPAIYCWPIDRWDFELKNSVGVPAHRWIGRRDVNSSVAIPRPPQAANLWLYKPGDLVQNLNHYFRENGQRIGLGMASAEIVSVEDALYGEAPVLIFCFKGVVEKTPRTIEIVNEGNRLLPS
jgi:hypothetical protein